MSPQRAKLTEDEAAAVDRILAEDWTAPYLLADNDDPEAYDPPAALNAADAAEADRLIRVRD